MLRRRSAQIVQPTHWKTFVYNDDVISIHSLILFACGAVLLVNEGACRSLNQMKILFDQIIPMTRMASEIIALLVRFLKPIWWEGGMVQFSPFFMHACSIQ